VEYQLLEQENVSDFEINITKNIAQKLAEMELMLHLVMQGVDAAAHLGALLKPMVQPR
jgi:predicted cupin superfamily sugar epimerase